MSASIVAQSVCKTVNRIKRKNWLKEKNPIEIVWMKWLWCDVANGDRVKEKKINKRRSHQFWAVYDNHYCVIFADENLSNRQRHTIPSTLVYGWQASVKNHLPNTLFIIASITRSNSYNDNHKKINTDAYQNILPFVCRFFR